MNSCTAGQQSVGAAAATNIAGDRWDVKLDKCYPVHRPTIEQSSSHDTSIIRRGRWL